MAAGLVLWAPSGIRAQSATVGDVVAAARLAATGQVQLTGDELQQALTLAVSAGEPAVAGLHTLIVELAVQWTVQTTPTPVADLFVDVRSVVGPGTGPWSLDLTLAATTPWPNALGIGVGSCASAEAAATSLGGETFRIETGALTLPPIDLFGTLVTISNAVLVLDVYAQAGDVSPYLGQGWVDLSEVIVEPPVDLAVVEAVLLNGRALTTEERGWPEIGGVLDLECAP